MQFQVWDFSANLLLRQFADQQEAYRYVRMLAAAEPGAINRLGLVTLGAAVLEYPLEGAPLLARAFGLEEGE